jgi:hypothetical protein
MKESTNLILRRAICELLAVYVVVLQKRTSDKILLSVLVYISRLFIIREHVEWSLDDRDWTACLGAVRSRSNGLEMAIELQK